MTETPQRTDQDILEIARSETYAGFEYLRAVRTGQERDDDAKVVNRKTQSIHVVISAYAKLISALAVKGPYGHQSEQELTPAERIQKLREFLRKPDAELAEAMAAEGLMMKAIVKP